MPRRMTAHCEAHPGLTGYGVSVAGDWGGLFSEEVRVPYADAMLQPLPDGVDPVAVASASDNLTDAYIGVATALPATPARPCWSSAVSRASACSPPNMPSPPVRATSISSTPMNVDARGRGN
jgi:threonine dehydrogenase-like Zn-dependent dehydrogenase